MINFIKKISYIDLFFVATIIGVGSGLFHQKLSEYQQNHLFKQCALSNNVDFSQSNNPSLNFHQELVNKEFPIIFYVSKHNSSVKEFESIKFAGDVWNKAIGQKVFIFKYTNKSLSLTKDNKNVIMFLNQWEDDKSTEQARTSTNYFNFSIVEADIRINIKNFKYYSLDSHDNTKIYSNQYNLESLLIHELGHVLGLRHYPQSVMDAYLRAELNRTNLTQTDLSLLACKYPEFKSNINKELAKMNHGQVLVAENSSLSLPSTFFNNKRK